MSEAQKMREKSRRPLFIFNNPKNMVTDSEMEDNKPVVRPHGSNVPRQAYVSEEKRSYDDLVNHLKKAASDARGDIFPSGRGGGK
jgi:hypothetical protein